MNTRERIRYQLNVLRDLTEDCNPSAALESIHLERYIESAFRNNEIDPAEYNRYKNELDEIVREFARECKCKLRY